MWIRSEREEQCNLGSLAAVTREMEPAWARGARDLPLVCVLPAAGWQHAPALRLPSESPGDSSKTLPSSRLGPALLPTLWADSCWASCNPSEQPQQLPSPYDLPFPSSILWVLPTPHPYASALFCQTSFHKPLTSISKHLHHLPLSSTLCLSQQACPQPCA